MSAGSYTRRAEPLRALLMVCAVVAVCLCATAPAVSAQDLRCGLTVNGVDVTNATSPDDPLELDVSTGSAVALAAQAPAGSTVQITANVGPMSVPLGESFVTNRGQWRQIVDLADHSSLGVGLYRIDVAAGPCSDSVWVTISGRSPLTTGLGVASVCLILIGLGGLVYAFVSSVRGRSRWLIAAASGAVVGLGANLLTQQLGTAAVTSDSLLLWTIVPGTVSAGVSALLRPRKPGYRQGPTDQGDSEEPPTRVRPSPDVGTTAPPPPPRSSWPPRPRPPAPPHTPAPRPPSEPAPGYIDDKTGSIPPVEPGMAGAPAPPPPAEARFVQGRVLNLADPSRPVPVDQAMRPNVPHRVEIEVGPPQVDPGWLRGPMFRDELPRDGRTHVVDVIVVAPMVLSEPVRGSIKVPRTGRSTRFGFELTVPPGINRLDARVMLLYRGRLLQTALLRAPVTATPAAGDRISLGLEAVLRTEFDDLEGRSEFGGALVFNHTAEDTGAVTQIVEGRASYLTLTSGLPGVVADLRADLETVTANSSAPRSLTAPETVQLLRILARKGVLLREEFTLGQGADARLLAKRRLQVLTVRAESFVPLEFVYDFPPPAMDATLCPDAVESLLAGRCAACEGRTEFPSPVVCPAGFWSVNRVIERQAARPADLRARGLDDRADVALIAQRSAKQKRLAATKAGLFAFHDRVDALKDGASVSVLKALREATKEHAVNAMTWQAWRDDVAASLPGILVLLPHTLTAESEPTLEIAASERLPRSFMSRALVGSGDPPVVLLLGCETALADVDFENFVIGFLRYGAAIVVGTVATVLGYQAAPVAAALVGELAKAIHAPKGSSFGEVIRSSRAKLLAEGHVMALSLTAYGDSDWQL